MDVLKMYLFWFKGYENMKLLLFLFIRLNELYKEDFETLLKYLKLLIKFLNRI